MQLHSLRHTLAFFADESTPASLADLRYVGKAAGMVTGVTLLVALAVFAGLLKVRRRRLSNSRFSLEKRVPTFLVAWLHAFLSRSSELHGVSMSLRPRQLLPDCVQVLGVLEMQETWALFEAQRAN